MILVKKEVRKIVKDVGKQINPDAISVMDRVVTAYVEKLVRYQREKRITAKSLQVI